MQHTAINVVTSWAPSNRWNFYTAVTLSFRSVEVTVEDVHTHWYYVSETVLSHTY